ncbi:TetR/AcrR family transcriptional regulator [Actinoplanes sp. N902-109]|uniref:TetR/AcrR family transcriptional regulator n=1 Tax=Actinoplanes sp. (strain N902-109) TaxID=649831 RepID=UPI00032960E0|nr:TetR/AcrR family transcriptional regulator [Actinoplanes sp. N902-109]AGL15917.1 transcriptional regulator, TetR family [Actinoplanes sp. N902-109]
MRQDARENREKILAAAETVFGAHGGAGSTEEVARMAGVGIATVFRHFPTKESLLEATLQRHFDHLDEQARALAAEPDPGTALRALIDALIRSGGTKLTLASALSDSTTAPPGIQSAADRLRDAVGAALRRAQQAGAARPDVGVPEVYLIIRGLAQVTATAPAAPAVLDKAIALVVTGLTAPARASDVGRTRK